MAREFTPDSEFAALETPRVPNKLQSLTALGRFEFEAGKGNEGTKILMVEWEDDDLTRSTTGSWHVSWDGKRTVLPAHDQATDQVRRCYFMLPPHATVPPTITLTYEPPPSSASTVKRGESIQINPLPAIYPPELGATARTAGKKGVLHTIWAKKRLQVLDKEIKEESQYNAEGIALHMAIEEKEWIEANFGVVVKRLAPLVTTNVLSNLNAPPLSPATPVSPTGGSRLSEKLRGLRLGTSEKDLTRKPMGNPTSDPHLHPLSPDEPDMAISSFSSFHTGNTPINAPTPRSQTQLKPQLSTPPTQAQADPPIIRQPIAHAPPDFIRQQQQQDSGFASLNMQPIGNNGSMNNDVNNHVNPSDVQDGLFAKALSPRSPDIPKSPFSFSTEETLPYAARQLNA
ncbi:uncharacterized protein GIQ15_02281 [Arthroderma uncinatum]|uniref:uncharacterized protein n=1 Tax=Arthroderma uncinatum TaxID=74035 RepID=UPI00144ABA00|nr:uncharacterized protein GIQ15_02281 [Arthroderma uncinatum]KAF3482957.1 hypothetical protein GIQ15_02281 [Arthroderma uncinatum]